MKSSFRTLLPGVAALVLASALTSCAGSGSAAELGAAFDEISERAAGEGELVVYSSAPDNVNGALTAAFNELHPDIKLTMTRLSTGDLRSRFASETSIGAQSADAVIVTDPVMFNENPEWFADLAENVVPNIANSREGFAHQKHVGLVTSPWVVTYNTDKIPEGPATWEDLSKPEFAENATLADPRVSSDSVMSFYQLLMDEYGSGYLKALGEQNDDWFDSSVPAVQKAAAGQVALAAPGSKSHSVALVESGAPLDVVIPEPVIAYTNQLGVAANATHPNAAMVFTDFMLSQQGQAAFCGDDTYMSLIKSEVEGCTPTPDDALIADPMRAFRDHDAILGAFEIK